LSLTHTPLSIVESFLKREKTSKKNVEKLQEIKLKSSRKVDQTKEERSKNKEEMNRMRKK